MNYRKLEHFGNLFKQALGDTEKILSGVSVDRNSELGKPPNALVFVIHVAYDFLVLQFEQLPLGWVSLLAGPFSAENSERLAARRRECTARDRVWRVELDSAKLGGKEGHCFSVESAVLWRCGGVSR